MYLLEFDVFLLAFQKKKWIAYQSQRVMRRKVTI